MLAERGGFEPPVQLLTVQRFSKPPPSATRPSLRVSVRIIPEFARLRSRPRTANPAGLASAESPPISTAIRALRSAPVHLHSVKPLPCGLLSIPTRARFALCLWLPPPTSWSPADPTELKTFSAAQAMPAPFSSCYCCRFSGVCPPR